MNDISSNNWSSRSDKSLVESIGQYIQSNRLNQNRSQSEVAKAAGISRSTLSLLERGENVSLNSLIQLLRVLGLLNTLEVFQIKNEISPVEYAKLQKNKRKRARNSGSIQEDDLGW